MYFLVINAFSTQLSHPFPLVCQLIMLLVQTEAVAVSFEMTFDLQFLA